MLLNEDWLSIADATQHLFSKSGKRIHVSTIHRWISRGIKGVRLETIRIGGRRFTSVQALSRFFFALSESSESCYENGDDPDLDSTLDDMGL